MSDYCGTARGLQTHENRNEPPCRFCIRFRDAPAPAPAPKQVPAAKKKRAPRKTGTQATRPGPRPLEQHELAPVKCGTTPGWSRHYWLKETPCEPCKAAKARYDAERHRAKQAAKPPKVPTPRIIPECGTLRAYHAHQHRKEPLDDACRQAGIDRRKELREKRKK